MEPLERRDRSEGQTDPALDRLVRSGNMSVLLTAKILALIEDSGATQVEILSAIGAVRQLIPSLPISLNAADDG